MKYEERGGIVSEKKKKAIFCCFWTVVCQIFVCIIEKKKKTLDALLVIYSVQRVIKSANLAIAELEEVQWAQYDKLEDTLSWGYDSYKLNIVTVVN